MKNNLSETFINKLKEIYNQDELKIIETGFLLEKRPVNFRVNTLKSSNNEIEKYLINKGLKIEKIPYLTNGYILLEGREKDLWNLDIFSEGKIYLQGITSQLIGEILSRSINVKNIRVLDLTASPGGKTSHISSILENKGEIVGNELNSIRFDKLRFTIERQGSKNVTLIKGDARNLKNIYEEGYFDIIIADLPCSAEGRINLNQEKSYKFLDKSGLNKKNYKLQQDILRSTIPLLKYGGELIYSTCTLDPLENEGIVHFLLSNYRDLEIQDISKIFDQDLLKEISKTGVKKYSKFIFRNDVDKSYRIFPSKRTEGFFVSKFKKISN